MASASGPSGEAAGGDSGGGAMVAETEDPTRGASDATVSPGIVSDPLQASAEEYCGVEMVGGIEGFTFGDVIEHSKLDEDLDIDFYIGLLGLDESKVGKCMEINAMIDVGVFKAIDHNEVDGSCTWLSAR